MAGRLQVTLCALICRQGDKQGGHLLLWGGHLGDMHPGASSPERQPAGHRVRFSQCLPAAQMFMKHSKSTKVARGLLRGLQSALTRLRGGHSMRAEAAH